MTTERDEFSMSTESERIKREHREMGEALTDIALAAGVVEDGAPPASRVGGVEVDAVHLLARVDRICTIVRRGLEQDQRGSAKAAGAPGAESTATPTLTENVTSNACPNCKGLADAHSENLREIGLLRAALAAVVATRGKEGYTSVNRRADDMANIARAALAADQVTGVVTASPQDCSCPDQGCHPAEMAGKVCRRTASVCPDTRTAIRDSQP